MWELLQKLENLWWKPYWKSIAELTETEKNVRLLTSLSSWLWQFVCENGMIQKENHERVYDVSWWEYWVDCKAQIISREPEYRLIESALKDESELESFILDNIKIDVESK